MKSKYTLRFSDSDFHDLHLHARKNGMFVIQFVQHLAEQFLAAVAEETAHLQALENARHQSRGDDRYG